MRTVIIIGIIIVLLLSGSLVSHQYLQATAHILGAQIETVEQSISTQKWELAQNELSTAQQRWDENKSWWTVLLDHQEIDTIDLSMGRLEKFVATQNGLLSLAEVSTLKLLVQYISDAEKLTLQNIL